MGYNFKINVSAHMLKNGYSSLLLLIIILFVAQRQNKVSVFKYFLYYLYAPNKKGLTVIKVEGERGKIRLFYVGKAKATKIASPTVIFFDTRMHACCREEEEKDGRSDEEKMGRV